MLDLIKSDFKRILKDKLMLVVSIIAAAFAIAAPLLYKAIFLMVGMEEELGILAEMGVAPTAKSTYFSAFMPGDNMGLIAPILISIILCKDFSHGTVRNKIIAGRKRWQVFLSSFIACATVLCALMLVYAILTLLISLLVFEYQYEPFTVKDFWYLLASTGMKILAFVFIAALICFLSVFMKNAGLTIVSYVAVVFLFVIVGSVMQVAGMMLDPTETAYSVLEFLCNTNIFIASFIGSGTSYSALELACGIAVPLLWSTLLLGLGLLVFKKKDIK